MPPGLGWTNSLSNGCRSTFKVLLFLAVGQFLFWVNTGRAAYSIDCSLGFADAAYDGM